MSFGVADTRTNGRAEIIVRYYTRNFTEFGSFGSQLYVNWSWTHTVCNKKCTTRNRVFGNIWRWYSQRLPRM